MNLLAFCIPILSALTDYSLESHLVYADSVFERALSLNTPQTLSLALKEYPRFKDDLEKILKSKKARRSMTLLLWLDCDQLPRNELEAALQNDRRHIEDEYISSPRFNR